MVSAGQHPDIEILNYSEVMQIGGFIGNYKVRVKRKASSVDSTKCNSCGLCQEKCPAKAKNDFEQGKTTRKAIYTLFAQAVPNVPVIDREACIYFQKGKCKVCQKICPKQAIDFEQQDRIAEINVGAIILATGHDIFDAREFSNYGYGRYPADAIEGNHFTQKQIMAEIKSLLMH